MGQKFTEIINGLFIDTENKKHSIVKNDIQEVLQSVIGGADMNRSSNREITLFIRDESEGITREQFEAAYPRQSDGPDFDEAPFIIGTSPQGNYIVGFDPIDLPDTITVTRNPNEETSHQLRNMSEQELIQYFDRISQEEEN